ncbi:MAG: protease inhibitor I42 family protein [Candidatus Binatia bacterium]|nr:protease inhibitor I42 family protein [Candidatus Binatia bacterium]
MQIHRKILVACLFLSGFLVGCAGVVSGPAGGSSSNSAAGKADALSCAVGKEVRVALPANPSTGFSWGLASKPDPSILKSEGADLVPAPSATPGAVGTGGDAVWTFRCLSPGTTTFRLVYRRVWEVGVPPAQSKLYEVRVEPSF